MQRYIRKAKKILRLLIQEIQLANYMKVKAIKVKKAILEYPILISYKKEIKI